MIHGILGSQSVTSLLHEIVGFTFYPTGSQYLGGFCRSSDRDYFTRYNWALEDFLKCNDFKKIDLLGDPTGLYRDQSLMSVWEKYCVVEQRNIQVQLIRPEWCDTKYRVNKFFSKNPKILSRNTKSQRAELWRALMDFDKFLEGPQEPDTPMDFPG